MFITIHLVMIHKMKKKLNCIKIRNIFSVKEPNRKMKRQIADYKKYFQPRIQKAVSM